MVQTDHKPVENILRKPLANAPLRLQAMFLKVSGKKQLLADTLSRANLNEAPPEDDEHEVNMLERISITKARYAQLQQSTANELH